MTAFKWLVVCLPLWITPAIASASSVSAKAGTLAKKDCRTLGEVRLCFNPSDAPDTMSLFVAGRKTRLVGHGWDKSVPFEMEWRNGVYRVKIGVPSRSDVDFFAQTEVKLRKSGARFLVDHYTIATDSKCENSPDIRMVYEFELREGTLTSVLAPPWSSDDKVHRYVRRIRLKSSDALRLSEWDFINLLGDAPGGAAIQRLCSA